MTPTAWSRFPVSIHIYFRCKRNSFVLTVAASDVTEMTRRLSEVEVEIDRKRWETGNSEMALNETNRQLESQQMELYDVNQRASSVRMNT